MRNTVLLIFITASIVLILKASAFPSDWKWFASSHKGSCFYDVESITHLTKDIVRVWGKQLHTKKDAAEYFRILKETYKNLEESRDLIEINCLDRVYRILITSFHTKEKDSYISDITLTEWESIIPESVMDALYKEVCRERLRNK